MDRWPLLLKLDVFTWETRTGSAGEDYVPWGPSGVRGAAGNWAKKSRQKRSGGLDRCCACKQDLAGFWSNSDFLFFFRKSMRRVWPPTAVCKKLEMNNLLWNWTVLVIWHAHNVNIMCLQFTCSVYMECVWWACMRHVCTLHAACVWHASVLCMCVYTSAAAHQLNCR